MEQLKEEDILSLWIKNSSLIIAKYEMLIDNRLPTIDRWCISDKFRKAVEYFSENYFYKELVYADLKFTPIGGTEVELADLIIKLICIDGKTMRSNKRGEEKPEQPV